MLVQHNELEDNRQNSNCIFDTLRHTVDSVAFKYGDKEIAMIEFQLGDVAFLFASALTAYSVCVPIYGFSFEKPQYSNENIFLPDLACELLL